MIVPIKGLYEAHLTVRDLDRSIAFYRDVLGLPLAHIVEDRNVAFFWVPEAEKAMLGLWGVGSAPMGMKLHIAFNVALEDIERSVDRLTAAGLQPTKNGQEPVDEPVVLSWMPAVSVYFDDPDGHSLEFIAMLPEEPRPIPSFLPLSEWRAGAGL